MVSNILIVDDEPLILDSFRDLLEAQSYHVMTAASAREAIALLKSNTVDVIVSDEKMPGIQGHELLAYVSQHYPSTIRILLTGHVSKELLIRAINETGGVFRFLTKPCPAETLLSVLKDALASGQSRSDTGLIKNPDISATLAELEFDVDGSLIIHDPGESLEALQGRLLS